MHRMMFKSQRFNGTGRGRSKRQAVKTILPGSAIIPLELIHNSAVWLVQFLSIFIWDMSAPHPSLVLLLTYSTWSGTDPARLWSNPTLWLSHSQPTQIVFQEALGIDIIHDKPKTELTLFTIHLTFLLPEHLLILP